MLENTEKIYLNFFYVLRTFSVKTHFNMNSSATLVVLVTFTGQTSEIRIKIVNKNLVMN